VAKTRREFTAEFKREAVRQATKPGNTIAIFSRDLGVHESVLRRWIQELSPNSEGQTKGLASDDEQTRELSRLRHQVINRQVARETIAEALCKFGTPSQSERAHGVW
jgi:transposase